MTHYTKGFDSIVDIFGHSYIPYRFAFNSQEKTDEIAGAGNHNTALFWEYDTRLGRRWNLDPKPTVGISEYACFGDNPIGYSDLLGDIVGYEKGRDKVNSFFARILSRTYRKEFRGMKASEETYTLRLRSNNSSLTSGGTIARVDDNNLNVLYSRTGSPNSPIGINTSINITIPRHIDESNQNSEDVKTYNLKHVDLNTPITIAPKAHPDNVNIIDNTGTSIYNNPIVNAPQNWNFTASSSSDGSINFPAPTNINLGSMSIKNSKNDRCFSIIPPSTLTTIQIQSINKWSRTNMVPSSDSHSDYRIEWRQTLLKMNIKL